MRACRNLLVWLFGLMLLASCQDDSYQFPSAVREFFVAYLAADSTVNAIETDEGLRFNVVENRTSFKGTPDSLARCIGYYEQTDGGVRLYSAKEVLSTLPGTIAEFDAVINDPVEVVSIWQAPSYLNMRLGVRHGGEEHEFDFVQDSLRLTVNGGRTDIWFSLYHDAHGDTQAFTDFVYGSLPLATYLAAYPKLVVHFTVNTYDEGQKHYQFEYNR
mgnify:CR=1 FL=1